MVDKRIPDGILSLFPLKKISPDPSVVPQSTTAPAPVDRFSHLCPSMGSRQQKYTVYRPEAKLPSVLSRLVQRGAKTVGVEEATLRYSIRRLEFKLFNAGREGSAMEIEG